MKLFKFFANFVKMQLVNVKRLLQNLREVEKIGYL